MMMWLFIFLVLALFLAPLGSSAFAVATRRHHYPLSSQRTTTTTTASPLHYFQAASPLSRPASSRRCGTTSPCNPQKPNIRNKMPSFLRMTLEDQSSSNSNDNKYPDLDDAVVASEETLLCVHLSRIPYADLDSIQTRDLLLQYTRSFPFAAVLPVQPLVYVPTPQGVEVRFLRKKTPTKPSIDGGIRIFIVEQQQNNSNNKTNNSLREEDEDDDKDSSSTSSSSSWTITAKRNSQGQSISKIFAEKLVIQEYLKGLMGTSQEFLSPPAVIQPRDVVQVTSVYHKWITENKR